MVYDPTLPTLPQTGGTFLHEGGEEVYGARLFFPDGKVFQYPSFSSKILSDPTFLNDVNYSPDAALSQGSMVDRQKAGEGQVEVFVCTHGSRDCRCSDRGGPLVDALREEVLRRGLEGKVKIGEIAHVGGHK